MRPHGRVLRLSVQIVVMAGLVLPILLGLWETIRAAFGVLPGIGAEAFSLEPWRRLLHLPGFTTSLRLTLVTGFGATLLALVLAVGFCAAVHGRFGERAGARMLSPFLAAPHAAIAIGLAFLIAPSGWIARLISPWATGWASPPGIATVNDPHGMALILGLLVKEVPFLLLLILSALAQLPVGKQLAAARALGYGRGIAWIKVIMPQVYPLIRLPIFVVLAFSLSVVDMAIILGPSNPPTLAVAITRWFADPDVGMILPASAGALLQAMIVGAGIVLWLVAERLGVAVGRWWIRRGGRGLSSEPGLWAASSAVMLLMTLGAMAGAALVLWSFAWRWPFPEAFPSTWSVAGWTTPSIGWGAAAASTLVVGLVSMLLGLVLAIAWLEGEDTARRGRTRWATAVIYVPLLIPQIGFLYGLNVVFLRAGFGGGMPAVVWAHALFVFPYVMIALSDPWRALDRRLVDTAAALGASPLRRLYAVKLPVLLRPLLTAAAIGFAVSVALYLPTLFMGAGRVATLTTEAVTLSSGSDRRVVGIFAVLQAALPFIAYATAVALPAIMHRNRRDLRGESAP